MNVEEYEAFRETILRVCDVLDAKHMHSYRQPFEVSIDEIDTPADALRANIAVLENMERFVLIYTHKSASSALIELGYAWKRGVPIYIFVKDGISLPFYLRDREVLNQYNIHMTEFSDMHSLLTLVGAKIAL